MFGAQCGTLIHCNAATPIPCCGTVGHERLTVFDTDIDKAHVSIIFNMHAATVIGCATLQCHAAQLHLPIAPDADSATVSVGSVAVADSATTHGQHPPSIDATTANRDDPIQSFFLDVTSTSCVTIGDQHVDEREGGTMYLYPARHPPTAIRDGASDHGDWCRIHAHERCDGACTFLKGMASADVEVNEPESWFGGVSSED
jgi:hypothetical protein